MQLLTPTGVVIEVAPEAADRYLACGFRAAKKPAPKEEAAAPSKKKAPKSKK